MFRRMEVVHWWATVSNMISARPHLAGIKRVWRRPFRTAWRSCITEREILTVIRDLGNYFRVYDDEEEYSGMDLETQSRSRKLKIKGRQPCEALPDPRSPEYMII